MVLAAELIATGLRLSRFFGLDFMIENGSNLTYLIEMNPRCTPLCHLQLGEGRDLIGALTAQLQGGSCRRLPPVTACDMIAYFPQALTCKSRFLQTSFNDVPEEEPELVEDPLHPWSEWGVLGRVFRRDSALQRDRVSGVGLCATVRQASGLPFDNCGRTEEGDRRVRPGYSADSGGGRWGSTQKLEFISDEQTEVYFKASDVSVLPYTLVFQSGVMFSSYSFGLPVIASDVGSEDILEGETGFVCRPCDAHELAAAIEKYFESDLSSALDRRRRQIQDFANQRNSWRAVGEKTRQVYIRLLEAER
jgi:Glycosyl transferases group 1